jgi:hypothetical protein
VEGGGVTGVPRIQSLGGLSCGVVQEYDVSKECCLTVANAAMTADDAQMAWLMNQVHVQ